MVFYPIYRSLNLIKLIESRVESEMIYLDSNYNNNKEKFQLFYHHVEIVYEFINLSYIMLNKF